MVPAITIAWRRRFGYVLIALISVFCAAVGKAAGGDDLKGCILSSEATPVATETASAGYVTNILNRAGSVRATSNRMLTSALDTARSKQPVQWVLFTSTPEPSKEVDDDDHMCARHEQATMKEPIEFEDRQFASADELTSWIMDFTQGRGADGESLYEQCPGKCSPRYTWWLEPLESGMRVKSRVICGLPRDHDGNAYHLTTALVPPCSGQQKQ